MENTVQRYETTMPELRKIHFSCYEQLSDTLNKRQMALLTELLETEKAIIYRRHNIIEKE